MIKNACAFTGHRPEKLFSCIHEDGKYYGQLTDRLNIEIENLVISGVTDFYTGMCYGVDMWCAEIVLRLQKKYDNLSLIAVVPFKKQCENWIEEYKNQYYHILDCCRDIIYISENYYSGCYRSRNKYLIEHTETRLRSVTKTN